MLVAGGDFALLAYLPGSPASELFDPVTETWSPGPYLAQARSQHTATLLADGSVLVVGGLGSIDMLPTPVSSTEVYDPGTSTWTRVGDLPRERFQHSATLLSDGQVLVAGGYDDGEALQNAELFPGAGEPLMVELTAPSSVRAGETVTLGLEARSAELDFFADLYLGVLMPDGQTLAFVEDRFQASFTSARLDGDTADFVSLYENLAVPLGLAFRDEAFLSCPFPSGMPAGNYHAFVALTPPGALDDGRLEAGDLLKLETETVHYEP